MTSKIISAILLCSILSAKQYFSNAQSVTELMDSSESTDSSSIDSTDIMNLNIESTNSNSTDDRIQLCHRPDRIRVFNALDIDNFNWSLREDSRDPDRKLSVVLSSYHSATIVNEKSSEHSGAAITTAIERHCEDHSGLLGEYNFDVILMNDQCNARRGVPVVMDMVFNTSIDVMIGMACSMVTIPIGFTLSYHDIPLISHASNSIAVNDKNTYNTLMRMGFGFKYIGEAFVDIFHEYGFGRAVGLITNYGLCDFAQGQIQRSFIDNDIVMPDWFIFDPENFNDQMIRETVASIKLRARVVYLCLWPNENYGKFMAEAERQGMTSPEFVFFTTVIAFIDDGMRHPWTIGADPRETYTEVQWEQRKAAYKHLRIVTTPEFKTPEDKAWQDIFHEKNQQPPFNWDLTNLPPPRNGRIMTLYDIAYHWLNMVNASVADGSNPRSGLNIFQKMRYSTYEGITGPVVMDGDGDRITSYVLWQYKDGGDQYTEVAKIIPSNPPDQISETSSLEWRMEYYPDEEVVWGTVDGLPPPDTPACGFLNEFCPPDEEDDNTIIILIAVFAGLAVLLIALYAIAMFIRRRQYEKDLKTLWEIKLSEIEFKKENKGSMSQKSLRSSRNSRASVASGLGGQIFTPTGVYKGVPVAIKRLQNPSFSPDKNSLVTLKQVKDMNHDNVNSFLGLSVSDASIFIVTSYCTKGSLQDVLENDDVALDKSFKDSLISDLSNGMKYIHDSPIGSHGKLWSGSCLINSRWVLKIANAGLHWLRNGGKEAKDTYKETKVVNMRPYDKLWMAPELLRTDVPPVNGTPKADMYSFGIVMQEILFRSQPYFTCDLTPEEIVERVKAESDPPFRPAIASYPEDVSGGMVALMEACLSENPAQRPNFNQVKKEIIKANKGKKVNIMDNMIEKLEKYANNLEDIVAKRTEELVIEKRKTDMLLYRMLPQMVAEKLKIGETVSPEIFDLATVYFSDIVGFTTLSSKSTPIQIVDLLNDLYTCFDDIIEKHDVYKVETIGDAYMCVSGIPKRNGRRHGGEIANMALELRDAVATFKVRHMPDEQLRIRIGIHSGMCAAGVVGLTMPRYCLFGDTVNTASRMESNSEAMKIHLSGSAHEVLEELGGYDTTPRGEIEVKGKGTMKTYWLEGKTNGE